MTIDSTWIARLKEDAPHCFTKSKPFAPACVFLDGQIKLMCPNSCVTRTWDDYVRSQFERSIQHYLDAGVRCVVLAFDDYQRVPQAKSMTQTKRRKHVPTMQFHERDELPPVVPNGERWVQCIVNRVFKSKVRLPSIVFLLCIYDCLNEIQKTNRSLRLRSFAYPATFASSLGKASSLTTKARPRDTHAMPPPCLWMALSHLEKQT